MFNPLLQPIGILDIGSNSIRFVVYEPPFIGEVPVFNEKVQCGLGRTLSNNNKLCKKGIKCTLESLAGFKSLAQAMEVHNIHVVGTAALRDAKDAANFVKDIQKKTGFKVRVIAGEQEAKYSALGVITSFPDAKGVVGDLGGGSLELARVDKKAVSHTSSHRLGALRIKAQKQKKSYIDAELEKIPAALVDDKLFYAVGGTWRTLAALHMASKGKTGYVLRGYKAAAKDMIGFCEKIAKTDAQTLIKKYHVESGRADLLPSAALLLARVLTRLKSKTVIFSDTSIREGVLLEAVQKAQLKNGRK